MPIRNRWKLGDHLVVCDRTGFVRYASETRKEWNGLRTWTRAWFPRQPQDLVRGLTDDLFVEDPRPRQISQFIGPLTAELDGDHAAGASTLTLTSSARFGVGDRLLVGLDNKQMFSTRVQTVPDATSVTVVSPLTWAASSGNSVINTSAVARSDLA
jgi:hypothetical protein